MNDQKPREFYLMSKDGFSAVHDAGTDRQFFISLAVAQSQGCELIHVIEKSAYDELLKRHLSIESIGPLALENEQLRADLDLAIEALTESKRWINHHISASSDDNVGSLRTALRKIDETLEKLQPNKGCERCKDWERMGLSNTCPTCDKIELDKLAKLQERK